MSDFGTNFKQTREALGLTLEQISAETRIGSRFLGAIEKEEFQLLPGGIFSRGFVRTYADRLGLDTEKAVADFERLSNYRDPSVMDGLRVSTSSSDKASRALYPVAIGGLIILVFVFYVLNRGSNTAVNASPQPPVSAPAPIVPPSPAPAPAQQTPAEAPAPTLPANIEPASTPAPIPIADVLILEITATESSWIKVTADGEAVVRGEILKSGMTRRVTAKNSISLVVGNAGGIGLKINDHAIPALGTKGQVRFRTITTDDLKSIIG